MLASSVVADRLRAHKRAIVAGSAALLIFARSL
jgi:hypothetical protein